jgi:prepilin-type N-terminal cleavage/methylation domain-containing protein
MYRIFKKKGMTLIETLVAIAIMSLLVMTATSLFVALLKGERRNQIASDVESQASFVIYQVAQSVRNAGAITSPPQGLSSSSLSLYPPTSLGESPMQYQLSNGSLIASYSDGTSAPLLSNTIVMTNLLFENITAQNTKGALRISFTIANKNPSGDPKLDYSTTRTTTITLR